ncbi:hypothetical protein [Phycicoccus sonneratiae]|uniref:Uncharacterized protein n=1 Tax=Phycicoccus sonneratiae TaxID=2807628 RepID=A0ABS2CSZ3_9MICO|nr:hypothetical protein [Phycicoccus sonneraticus]MBM6402281.1 hypothetical protein [Phycicoccus sonneraticus]
MTDPLTDLATALSTLATASKSQAEADKTRADAEKVRADLEVQKAHAQIATDAAAADLRAKQLANDKARADLDAARTDKLIERLTGAVPDLSGLQKNAVTFGDGRALRQNEAVGLAVAAVAQQVASDVAGAVPHDGGAPVPVFVTAETSLVAAVAAYWQVADEAADLGTRLAAAGADAAALLPEAPAGGDRLDTTSFVDPATTVAAVAGAVVTQVASLFEVDTAVTSNVSDVASLSVQTAVLHHLVTTGHLRVRHHWTRVPDDGSPLRTSIRALVTGDVEAAETDALLGAAIGALGDPQAVLDRARKDAKDPKLTDEERQRAQDVAAQAEQDVATLAALGNARTRLAAVVAKVRAFADRVGTASAGAGPSALAAAYAIEPLGRAGTGAWVLVVGPARAETHQVVVTRRLFSPRLHLSTGVEVDYVLLQGDTVRRADHATASAAFSAKLKGNAPDWSRRPSLT